MPSVKNSENLKTMSFTINQEKFARYTSSKRLSIRKANMSYIYTHRQVSTETASTTCREGAISHLPFL